MEDNKIKKIKITLLIALVVFLVGVLFFSLGTKMQKQSKEFNVINDILDVILNSRGTYMVYLGGEDCDECDMQSYQMQLFLSDYDLEYYYISLDSISDSKANRVLKDLGLASSTQLPTIAIYKDGNLVVSQSGLVGTNSLYNLFKNNSLINDEKLKINYLTLTSYVEKVTENNLVLAIGSMKSQNSILFEQRLWELASDSNVNINFLYTSNLNRLEGKLFESKLHNFDDYMLEVPALMIVDNGVIQSALIGLYSTQEYLDFLKENGIIE